MKIRLKNAVFQALYKIRRLVTAFIQLRKTLEILT